MKNHARQIAAICEFLAPAAIVILNSVLPGSDAGGTITPNEIVCAVMTSVVTYGAYARATRLITLRGVAEAHEGPPLQWPPERSQTP